MAVKPKGDKKLPLEEVIEAALQTKPMTPEEKAALEEAYKRRVRGSPGRKAKS